MIVDLEGVAISTNPVVVGGRAQDGCEGDNVRIVDRDELV